MSMYCESNFSTYWCSNLWNISNTPYLLQLSFKLIDEISFNLTGYSTTIFGIIQIYFLSSFSCCVTSFLPGITSIRTGPPVFYRENCQLVREDTYLTWIQDRCASELWISTWDFLTYRGDSGFEVRWSLYTGILLSARPLKTGKLGKQKTNL